MINKHTEAWHSGCHLHGLKTSEDTSPTRSGRLGWYAVVVRAEERAQQSVEAEGADEAFAGSPEASEESTSKPVGAAAVDDDEV